MTFQFWRPPYGTNLDPYEVRGEARARRFAQNFEIYNGVGFGNALTAAQILAQAKDATLPLNLMEDVFCEQVEIQHSAGYFWAMFQVGDRLCDLDSELGGEGAMWLMLYSLKLMSNDDFDRMLKLGKQVRHRSTEFIMDEIAESARD